MVRSINQFSIVFFVGVNYAYDCLAPSKDTNWSIAFFFAMYFCMAISFAFTAYVSKEWQHKVSGYLCGSIVFFRGFYELSHINLPYDEYIKSANSSLSEAVFLAVGFVFVSSHLITLIMILRNHIKKKKSLNI